MNHAITMVRRAMICLVIAFCAALALSACGSSSSSDSSSSSSASSEDGTWPRTFKDDAGHEVKLDKKPSHIVSTSVTLTGSLLAIDAPVKASGGTAANTPLSDDKGFFKQWSDVAKKKDVKSLYTGDPSAEKILGEDPDLIIIAKNGGDSAANLYDQLKDVAPTAVIDYSTSDWEDISQRLGKLTGHESQAQKLSHTFDDRAAEVKKNIDQPQQPVTPLVYNAASFKDAPGGNIWTEKSAQGKLLKKVGFDLADVPEETRGSGELGQREDIYQISGENLAKAVTGKTVFLFAADDSGVKTYQQDKLLTDTPAVKDHSVYALGQDSFRLDYYSATNVLDKIEKEFKK